MAARAPPTLQHGPRLGSDSFNTGRFQPWGQAF